MNSTDYDRLSQRLAKYAADIQTSKRPGYTTGSKDVLNNFKSVAARLGLSAEQAWATYFLKHIDAITTFMTKPDLPVSEEPIGRFADAINYLYLGYALFTERDQAKEANDRSGSNQTFLTAEKKAEFEREYRLRANAGGPAPVAFERDRDHGDERDYEGRSCQFPSS